MIICGISSDIILLRTTVNRVNANVVHNVSDKVITNINISLNPKLNDIDYIRIITNIFHSKRI